MKFVLSKKIIQAFEGDGFVGAIVYGKQRLGKSSYALQVLADVYGNWNRALDFCVFDLRDVIRILESAVKMDRKIPAIVWDDCGVHGNKMLYFTNRSLVQYLNSLIDVVGISVGGLILTTPSPANVLRAVRGYEFFRIKIFKDGSYRRHATGYLSSLLPSGTRVIRRMFTDYYDVRMPDGVWNEYVKKRREYLAVALKQLSGFLEKR